ncbi:hypothetical protein Ciccas_004389 [Cichlidogyrus casuarinus]|uniref:Uncharacterized protein n=1 Tax=Cichlidogyrus casuarinus TaxID=1844966 RepID=A0ABD2QBR4_9PLAT
MSNKFKTTREYEAQIRHQDLEIELLQKRNRSLVEKLENAEKRISQERIYEIDLDAKNKDLETELNRLVDRTCKLQQDHETAMRSLKDENRDLRGQVESDLKIQADLEMELNALKKENHRLVKSLEGLENQVSDLSSETRIQHKLLMKCEDDKKRLTERIDRLVANERALVMEMERMKKFDKVHGPSNAALRSSTKKTTTVKLDEYLKGIEEDRDYWRSQVQVLSKINLSKQPSSPSERPIACPKASRTCKRPSSSGVNVLVENHNKLKADPTKRTSTPCLKIKTLEDELSKTRKERDGLRDELRQRNRPLGRSYSPATLARSQSLSRSNSVSLDSGLFSSQHRICSQKRAST